MTTIRVARRERYVVIDQTIIRNPQLSFKAIGLLTYLLSFPDNWRINAEQIAKHKPDGRDAIRTGLQELEEAGHLVRNRYQGERGRWCTDLVLYETPVDNPATDDGFSVVGPTRGFTPENRETAGRTDDGFSGVGKSGVGKPVVNRKTVDELLLPAESSRDGITCPGCDGWPFDEETRTVSRCPTCNPAPKKIHVRKYQ